MQRFINWRWLSGSWGWSLPGPGAGREDPFADAGPAAHEDHASHGLDDLAFRSKERALPVAGEARAHPAVDPARRIVAFRVDDEGKVMFATPLPDRPNQIGKIRYLHP